MKLLREACPSYERHKTRGQDSSLQKSAYGRLDLILLVTRFLNGILLLQFLLLLFTYQPL